MSVRVSVTEFEFLYVCLYTCVIVKLKLVNLVEKSFMCSYNNEGQFRRKAGARRTQAPS